MLPQCNEEAVQVDEILSIKPSIRNSEIYNSCKILRIAFYSNRKFKWIQPENWRKGNWANLDEYLNFNKRYLDKTQRFFQILTF